LVLENIDISRSALKGPISHQGVEPIPPGFESKAKFGPPPESAKPGSSKYLVGCRSASVLNGAFSKKGIASNKTRF